jgi:hypothetical protein
MDVSSLLGLVSGKGSCPNLDIDELIRIAKFQEGAQRLPLKSSSIY